MNLDELVDQYIEKFRVKPGEEVNLKKYDTDCKHEINKEEGAIVMEQGIQALVPLQDRLYANHQYSVLVIFQAMDAAGKDSTIKHVMRGLNPQGVRVTSFKTPTPLELSHDYLWRHYIALPAKGEIGIFNRSHYENVLVTRVHPEYILGLGLPGIDDVKKIDNSFWKERFKQISGFEKTLSDNGTLILKFFLHVSKKEQKKRFLERIDKPEKNWKFSSVDLKEREYWKDYRKAYEELLSNTSGDKNPWFVIPADDKWFMQLIVAGIIYKELNKLGLHYPVVTDAQQADLQKSKEILMNEKKKDTGEEGEDQE